MLPSAPESLAAFDKMLFDSCALVRPPEKLTVAEWADKYGMLSAEGSARPGKFYVSNAEYQREPFEALSPGSSWETVVLLWASQVGKTQIALFLTAYHVHHDPAPILFVEPTEDLCKVIVRDRIDPMIRDTPELRELFAQRNKGKADLMHKPFPGGQISMGWANSPSQLASRPVRILITDEEGRYGPNAEGDPVEQGRKRMATFRNRKHARISSPGLRRTCSATKAYEHSDQRKYYVPCPQCGEFQTLKFGQIKGTPEDCYYVCEANGCLITEDDKAGMILKGEWRAENPGGGDGKTAGFQLSALYSTIGYTWGELLADYRKANVPELLQVFTNTVLAEPWDEEAEGADLNEVAKRAEEYPAPAPGWVVFITCGADVQKDRIEATKWGWGLNKVAGPIEHRIFHGDPEKHPEVWAAFEAWRAMEVEHETGLHLPTACTFIDSGDGNRTQAVYDFTRPRRRKGILACKGSSLPGAPVVGREKPSGKKRTPLVIVGTSTVKDTLFGRLGITDPSKPGYIHFPSNPEAGCDREYFSHLTAEKLVTHRTKGGERAVWEKQQRRNEALDCAVYAYAAKEFTRAPIEHLARRLEARAAALPPEQRPGSPEYAQQKQMLALARAIASRVSSPESPSAPSKPKLRRKRRTLAGFARNSF